METKFKDMELDKIKLKYGFNYCLGVNCVGEGRERARDISLLWIDQVNLNVISYSLHHIGAFYEDDSGKNVLLYGIYGYLKKLRKKDTWDLIISLRPMEGIWLCFVEVNISNTDKSGGNIRSSSQLERGRQVFKDYNLIDVGYEGCNAPYCF